VRTEQQHEERIANGSAPRNGCDELDEIVASTHQDSWIA
jgi:hypothetical protein